MNAKTPLAEVVAWLEQEGGIAMTLIEKLEGLEYAGYGLQGAFRHIDDVILQQVLSALRIATEYVEATLEYRADDDKPLHMHARKAAAEAAFLATFAPASAGKEEQEK